MQVSLGVFICVCVCVFIPAYIYVGIAACFDSFSDFYIYLSVFFYLFICLLFYFFLSMFICHLSNYIFDIDFYMNKCDFLDTIFKIMNLLIILFIY